ncbi:MAG: hypothetical protein Harvfovirus27_6 [Harvfovirus sp.]|uniref:Uncharacterized protein n=1 Tax=Harvfovirus sp. TaxID=2487768 RepID=A0A3G5A264_9VIRU|nr:MAG: hypothetical protein Harvfovirus27_6 [Harvfovirus sp.]
MLCKICDVILDIKMKFCFQCGTKIEIVRTLDDFSELLREQIEMTDLIYDISDINETKHVFKIKEIIPRFNGDGYNFLDYMTQNPTIFGFNCFTINAYRIEHRLNDFYHINNVGAKLYRELETTRLFGKLNDSEKGINGCNQLLKMSNIHHTAIRGDLGCEYESFKNILIRIIENKIFNPKCGGSNILGSTNYDLNKLYRAHYGQISAEELKKYIAAIENDKLIISYKCMISTSFDEKYIEDRVTSMMSLSAEEQKYYGFENIEQIRKQVRSKLQLHINHVKREHDIQMKLDLMLNKIQTDIYYSSKTRNILTRKQIEDHICKFMDIYDFVLEKHCELFKLKHINVYILNQEIEDMLYLQNIFQKFKSINTLVKKKEGIEEKGILSILLG